MAAGLKLVETRSWQTYHRGPLAIAASKTEPADYRYEVAEEPMRTWLAALAGRESFTYEEAQKFFKGLPRGQVLCTLDVIDCVKTESIRHTLSVLELGLGNYEQGRFAWVTQNMKKLDMPRPCKGALGLWDWEGAPER
jgi:hypothetical protein